MGIHWELDGNTLKTKKIPKIDPLSPTTKEQFIFLLGACYITTLAEQNLCFSNFIHHLLLLHWYPFLKRVPILASLQLFRVDFFQAIFLRNYIFHCFFISFHIVIFVFEFFWYFNKQLAFQVVLNAWSWNDQCLW